PFGAGDGSENIERVKLAENPFDLLAERGTTETPRVRLKDFAHDPRLKRLPILGAARQARMLRPVALFQAVPVGLVALSAHDRLEQSIEHFAVRYDALAENRLESAFRPSLVGCVDGESDRQAFRREAYVEPSGVAAV